jgi:formylglycine-generating enzyme required for sulfatase activity
VRPAWVRTERWWLLVLAACGDPEVPPPPAPAVHVSPDQAPGLDALPDGRLLPTTGQAPPEPWQCDRDGQILAVISQACFVQVPGGRFVMGAQATDPTGAGFDPRAEAHEGPVHEVAVEGFWIQRREVNAALYTACLQAGWCKADEVSQGGGFDTVGDPNRGGLPANGVSWHGAVRLCDWLGGRLPTEAEWEFAARGPEGRRYPWGREAGCGFEGSWSDRQRAGEDHDVPCLSEGPRPTHEPRLGSPFGVFGQAGNVWEWVDDWYAPDAYARHPERPATGDRKVQRGGGWLNASAWELRSAARGAVPPDQKLQDVGLRCVWPGR